MKDKQTMAVETLRKRLESTIAAADKVSVKQITVSTDDLKLLLGKECAPAPKPAPAWAPWRHFMNSNVWVERGEDMSTTGHLRLMRQEDGDMCVAIIDEKGRVASVEFCAPLRGGGRSPETLTALYALAQAIIKDNADVPINGRALI